jgi:ribulose-phosphate 3-epimerase
MILCGKDTQYWNNMKKEQYKLAASLICGDFLHLEKDIELLVKGKIDYIHFDVMDGSFVPRFGLFPEIISQIRTITDIPMDIHMMVDNAEHYLQTFIDAGVNKKDDIFVIHAETTHHIDRVIRKIKAYGIKAGVALNPGTSLHILDYVLSDLDLVMLMAINPGIVGHKLIPSMMEKIKDLKKMTQKRKDFLIEVDGGVTFDSMLVCGTQTIYKQKKPLDEQIKLLRQTLDSIFS